MTAIEIAWTWLNSNVVAVTSIVGTVTAIATIVLIAATIITGKRVAAQTAATTRATDVVVAENMAAYQARMMDDAVNLRGVRKNVAIWNLVELAEERGQAGAGRKSSPSFGNKRLTSSVAPTRLDMGRSSKHGIVTVLGRKSRCSSTCERSVAKTWGCGAS